MNIKMIALDLDGTLLDDNKNISKENKRIIRKALDKGINVIVCSGRIVTTSLMYADEIGANKLIIVCNGGNVIDLTKNININNEILDLENVKKAIDIFHDADMYFHTYIDNCLVTEKMEFHALSFNDANKNIPEKYRLKIKVVDDIMKYINDGNGRVSKFVAVSEDIEYLSKVRNMISHFPRIELASSAEGNFEIMKKGVNKGEGIRLAAEYLGINLDEIMAIGDNENDLTMLETVGFPIVMDNAEDKIKEKGIYITKSNIENGVAYAIEKYVLK